MLVWLHRQVIDRYDDAFWNRRFHLLKPISHYVPCSMHPQRKFAQIVIVKRVVGSAGLT